MLYTSNIRGLRKACHWLAMNLVGDAAVIHPKGINAIGKIYLKIFKRHPIS
jgi:hypothetical protein